MSPAPLGLPASPAVPSRGREKSRARRNPRLVAGGIGLLVFVLAAVLGPAFAPFNPDALDTAHRLLGPTSAHLLGTDALGRDILSRLLFGLQPSLVVGIAAIMVAAILGTLLGVLSGYFGAWLDAVVGRILDLLWAWPAVFLAIAFVLVLGPGQAQNVLAIGVAELPVFARVVRAVTIATAHGAHVEAARSLGAGRLRVMRRHVLPFAVPALIVQFAISAPEAVVTGTALNYLGLGIQPPSASLGSMINETTDYLGSAPSGALFPILAIAWIVLSLTLIADGLQDIMDPRFQRAKQASTTPRSSGPVARRAPRRQAVRTLRPLPSSAGPLLEVRQLRVAVRSAGRDYLAVRGVSLSVARRSTVALVGESGSGKSLTALSILGLTPPGSRVTADGIRLDGIDIIGSTEQALREVRGRRVGMVFQDPTVALNPVLTVGRQITEVLSQHLGLRGRAARDRATELLELVEIPDPARRAGQYPHQLSGGTQQRVMIAIALAAGPELLIADEPTTALDVTLQAQVMRLLARLRDELGMAMLLISHDLGVVAAAADEVSVMYAGQIVEHADVRSLFHAPAHPYTRALLRSVSELDSPDTVELTPIPGAPPTLGTVAPGCPFAPRCASAFDRCHVEAPTLLEIRAGHHAACHLCDIGSTVPERAR